VIRFKRFAVEPVQITHDCNPYKHGSPFYAFKPFFLARIKKSGYFFIILFPQFVNASAFFSAQEVKKPVFFDFDSGFGVVVKFDNSPLCGNVGNLGDDKNPKRVFHGFNSIFVVPSASQPMEKITEQNPNDQPNKEWGYLLAGIGGYAGFLIGWWLYDCRLSLRGLWHIKESNL